jgi:hypothetical protein
MLEYLIGVSGNLLAAILYDAGRGRYCGFNSMLEKALDDTNIHFQEKGIEFRTAELREILSGHVAERELERFKQGDRFINGDELAKEFASLGDLYFQDESLALTKAREILQFFLERFEGYQLADAKTNAPVLLSYLKILSRAASEEHKQMSASLWRIERTQQKMQRQIADLAAVSNTKTARVTAIMRGNTLADATDSSFIDWDPAWKPRKIVANARFDGEASAAELKPGASVIVSFEERPSPAWRDPKVAAVALWDIQTASARALSPTLWNELRSKKRTMPQPTSVPGWKVWPLCIPSYDVSVEWRLESYCFLKPWRDAKERVVQSFLRRCRGNNLECRVISLERRPGQWWELLVQSADYDNFLHMEWPYYKGLESALGRGQYYKSHAIQALSGADLKQFAQGLSENARFRDLIPKRYRDCFQRRAIQGFDVSLMLKGIAERERQSRERWQLR